MTLYDITQYAPHTLAVLCLVCMLGISGPTLQKPTTWHLTLFIVMAFSVLNILMAPVYNYFMSGADLMAHSDLMMIYVYLYSWFAALDFFTASLIRKFAQKGRAVMALVMAGFIFVELMTIVDILATSKEVYSINTFGFNILNATDSVYRNYVELIAILNLSQALLLIGAFRGWSIRNVTGNVLSFLRFSDNPGGAHARLVDICYSKPNKGSQA